MLYCKQCGNQVNDTDRFCENCSARLDIKGNVLNSAEYAYKKLNGAINVEEIQIETDLCGSEIFGYRIIKKLYSAFEFTYYQGTKNKTDKVIIQYTCINRKLFNLTDLNNSKSDKDELRMKLKKCADEYQNEFNKFNSFCLENNINNPYIDIKILFSEQTQSYHIFWLMKNVIPFRLYENNGLTVRNVIEIGIKICKQLIPCHNKGICYDQLTDVNLFCDENKIYLGDNSSYINEKFVINLEKICYCKTFSTTSNSSIQNDIYSLAICLYKLLNKNVLPFQNYYNIKYASDFFFKVAQYNIINPKIQMPCFAQNMLGKTIIKCISSRGGIFKNIEEFNTILENSLNFIPADELNVMI